MEEEVKEPGDVELGGGRGATPCLSSLSGLDGGGRKTKSGTMLSHFYSKLNVWLFEFNFFVVEILHLEQCHKLSTCYARGGGK